MPPFGLELSLGFMALGFRDTCGKAFCAPKSSSYLVESIWAVFLDPAQALGSIVTVLLSLSSKLREPA